MLGALSFEQTMLVSKFCNDILSLAENISLVSVISRHGRQIDSKFKGDSPFNDLTKHEMEQVNMQRMLQTQMTKDFDDKLGRFEVSTIEREFCTECIFPFYDGVLLVVFASNTQTKDHTKKITDSIKSFNFKIATTSVSC
jgi:hypothetical protein